MRHVDIKDGGLSRDEVGWRVMIDRVVDADLPGGAGLEVF